MGEIQFARLFIAVAAAGIAVLAIFGYSELRSNVDRRTDEGLKKILDTLRRKGLLSDNELPFLQDEVLRRPKSAQSGQMSESESSGRNENANGNTADLSANSPIAREYPQRKEDEEI